MKAYVVKALTATMVTAAAPAAPAAVALEQAVGVAWAQQPAPVAAAARERLPVAVLPFQRYDASANADSVSFKAAILAHGTSPEGLLSSALAAGGRYAPVDSATLARATAASWTDGQACRDLACAVAAGRAAGVPRVVTGRVSKLSTIIWFVSLTLVDVAGERVQHQEEIELKGDMTDLLPKGMVLLARRLAARDTVSVAQRAPPGVRVNSAIPAVEGAPPERQVMAAPASFPNQHIARDDESSRQASAQTPRRLSRVEVERVLAASSDDHPADLRHVDLSGLDFGGVDFRSADLTGSRLVKTRFARARLFGATLSGAVARDADFSDAMLDVAVLRGTDLTGARLRNASLYATILINANLTRADLSGARVIGVFTNATLAGATLTDVRMGADPGNQPMGLMRTDLADADLRGATLTRADLRKANLVRADLTGADLTDADLAGANLAGTVLHRIQGRDRLRGLDRARNVDQALFDPR